MALKRVLFLLTLLLAGVLVLPAPSGATLTSIPAAPAVPPTPAPGGSPSHIPYDPTLRHETLPRYPYAALRSPAAQLAGGGLPKPAGVDLDVTYISREPGYHHYEVWYTADMKPYLRPGSEDDRRWPAAGEVVTFTAHFANKGTLPSGNLVFKWFIDSAEVSVGARSRLAPGEQTTAVYRWVWPHELNGERLLGSHTVRFTVDPANAIPETYESNNSLEDRTDAINLTLAVTPELYAALETPADPKWPFSAEDWLQKQIAAMNAAFARSVYPSAPAGITERVRLGKILVTATAPPADPAADGGFYMSGDDRQGNPYYHPATDVSGALLHELAHQLGVIDLYNLGAEMLSHQLVDRDGQPVQIETGLSYLGLMLNPGIDPPIFEEHSALALNANKGFRRGYYGEYLFDLPGTVRLRVLDAAGAPAAGVTVRLYQAGPGRDLYPTLTDGVPEITGTTNGDGLLVLANRPVGDPVTTRTRHTLRDNPFGIVDIIGERDDFVVELSRETHQEYAWLEITRLNLAAWRGETAETTIDLRSYAPAAGAPPAPADLSGAVEFGQVVLRWPTVPAPAASYALYRTRFRPDFTYEHVATGLSAAQYTAPYDYGQRAVTYAVVAVDAQGRESGFSRFFNAFSLVNPAAIAVAEDGRRIVLDPQNGYAVLAQAANGRWLDTLGSVHHHLEFSWYMARDGNGRLIFSHPGDWYSNRHSVKVANTANDPLFEFGETGSGPGQFINPSGVAVWGPACSIEGPYPVDANTLLLLHFDGSYDGAGGEAGDPNGTSFAAGRYGQGLSVGQVGYLSYETTDNLNREQGAIEFWVQPNWDGDDEGNYNFFEVGQEWFNRIRITKDGANNLRLMVWDDQREYGVAYNVGHWRAGEWHHIAATWSPTALALYTDGEPRGQATGTRPPQSLAERLFIGSDSGGGYPAQALIDEFRISVEPRVGNSDACTRLLVADSANARIQAFDALGGFLTAYGSTGSGPGQFRSPQGLAVDDRGRVIVADAGNNRLQLLSFDGRAFGYLRSIDGFNWPTGVWAYGSDRILVAETGANAVKEIVPEGGTYVAKEHGEQQTPFNAPHGVAADQDGNLIVADTGNRRIVTIPRALPTFTPAPPVTPTTMPTATPTSTPTATPEGDLTLTGLVYNAGWGRDAPIGGASVWATMCVPRTFTAMTGPDGRYSLFIPGPYLQNCPAISLSAWAPGFAKVELEATVNALRADPVQDFGLLPSGPIVDTTDDELNTDGDCSLREAIQAANTDAAVDACPAGHGADTIRLPEGVYQLARAGAGEDANAVGDLDILADLILVGGATDATVIHGGQLDRVLHVHTGVTARLSGVTITRGRTVDGRNSFLTPQDAEGGGGIFNAGVLTLDHCAVTGNRTGDGGRRIDQDFSGGPGGNGGSGGGIYNQGTLTAIRSQIKDNFTGSGGSGTTGTSGNLTVGQAGAGGGIYNAGQGDMWLDTTLVRGNSTADGSYLTNPVSTTGGPGGDGGGIFNAGSGKITNSTVAWNRAGAGHQAGTHGVGGAGGNGGGIFNTGSLTVSAVTVNDNEAGRGGDGGNCGIGGDGGGIANSRDAALHVLNSTVSFNRSGDGGSTPGSPACRGGDGGGVHGPDELMVDSSTFSGNDTGLGGSGGGIFVGSGDYGSLRNTILAGNTATHDGPDCAGLIELKGHNLLQATNGCILVIFPDAGPNLLGADPLLEARINYGGPTETHALRRGSPAIDAGTCTTLQGDLVPADQRGVPRPQGPACDIGAFELQRLRIYLPVVLR